MGMDTILGNGGIHHVAVRTTDLDASVRFYTGVLGMSVVAAFELGRPASCTWIPVTGRASNWSTTATRSTRPAIGGRTGTCASRPRGWRRCWRPSRPRA